MSGARFLWLKLACMYVCQVYHLMSGNRSYVVLPGVMWWATLSTIYTMPESLMLFVKLRGLILSVGL